MLHPSRPRDRAAGLTSRTRVVLLAAVAGLAITIEILRVHTQIFDTNFCTLFEATCILGGDHPYRDFFEWGLPLQAALSTAGQVLSGGRLIGEFVIQWAGTVTAMVLGFHLALRLSGSVFASCAATLITLILLPVTPTLHYPKLFLYPLGVLMLWRYLDHPSIPRAAGAGLVTAIAFLFRHDHGLYIAAAAATAWALVRLVAPSPPAWRSWLRHGVAYTVTGAAIVLPWAVVVAANEGLPEYIRSRAQTYGRWSAHHTPYRLERPKWDPARALVELSVPPAATRAGKMLINLRGALIRTSTLPQEPGDVSFEWQGGVRSAQRVELERRHGLELVQGPGDDDRWRYRVADLSDTKLLDLAPYIRRTDGFDWDRLYDARHSLLGSIGLSGLVVNVAPGIRSRDNAMLWILEVSLVVPLACLAAAAWFLAAPHGRWRVSPAECGRLIVASALVVVVEQFILREKSYALLVSPVVGALGAWLLARAMEVAPARPDATGPPGRAWRLWLMARRAMASSLLVVTAVAAFDLAQPTEILRADAVAETFHRLLAYPPIDGTPAPPPESGITGDLITRYVHDCSRPEDRLLILGSTPYSVNYYANRRLAGGHLFWHNQWRSDPWHELQSLTMLERQSVPFAVSTADPVLDDFKAYPRIRAYLVAHYAEIEGSRGRLLVDTRRTPTGTYEPFGLPCFR